MSELTELERRIHLAKIEHFTRVTRRMVIILREIRSGQLEPPRGLVEGIKKSFPDLSHFIETLDGIENLGFLDPHLQRRVDCLRTKYQQVWALYSELYGVKS